MKTFKAIFKKGVKGVYAISLVNEPAMEGEFVKLSKQEVQLKSIDSEKRILLGLVLEPNKLIYRNDGKIGEYQIVFDEPTIELLAHDFQKKNSHHNSTIEHSGERIEGVTFVESWIVENSKIDKSAIHGLEYPKGSWVAMMKVDNNEIWEDYVKTGRVKGFSIDAMVDFEKVEDTKLSNMDNKKKEENLLLTAINGLKDVFLKAFPEPELNLGSVKSEDGELTIIYDGEVLQKESTVYLEEEGERINLLEGEYPIEGGKIIVVGEKGVVIDVKDKEDTDVEPQTKQMNDDKAELSQVTDAINQIKNLVVKYSEDTSSKFELLKSELSKKDEEIKLLQDKVTEMSKAPKTTPLKTQLSQAEYEKLSSLEKYRIDKQKHRI